MGNVRIENGRIVGTSGNKYKSKNPIGVHLIAGFDRVVAELVSSLNPRSILEVGCGEGHVTEILLKNSTAPIHATDISVALLAEAKIRLDSDRVSYEVMSLEKLRVATPPELVVCCEVLEHLENPRLGLEALRSFGAKRYILSVPREPLWRILNFTRGAYLSEWGNSPGHLQHWSRDGFVRLVTEYFEVVDVRSPLPWTMLLCRAKP